MAYCLQIVTSQKQRRDSLFSKKLNRFVQRKLTCQSIQLNLMFFIVSGRQVLNVKYPRECIECRKQKSPQQKCLDCDCFLHCSHYWWLLQGTFLWQIGRDRDSCMTSCHYVMQHVSHVTWNNVVSHIPTINNCVMINKYFKLII